MKTALKRITMGIGGTALTALLLALAAPKAVHAIVTTLVTVANTAANPVPVDSSAAARSSIALFSSLQIDAPNSFGQQPFLNISDNSIFVVPAGKRFVIDQVTAAVFTVPGAQPILAIQSNQGNGHPYYAYIPLTEVPATASSTDNAYEAMERVTFFVDPGGPFQSYFEKRTTNDSGNANIFVTGHMIDCGSGCAGQ